MKPVRHRRSIGILAALLLIAMSVPSFGQQRIFRHPQPGEVYKEYLRLMDYVGKEFRVTWPNSPVDRAIAELPNSILDISVDDLQGATRAELVVDFWGGHAGTVGKQIRFNENAWLDVPDLTTVTGSPECYVTMRNVTIDIPLGHLVEGTNSFEGTNTGQTCNNFQWGLWGWYGVILRVYYEPSKPHATGTISSYGPGDALPENPTIAASVTGSVSRVDFLAYYDGYDEDGDGFYQDYHHSYHRRLDEYDLPIRNHLGSATGAPWQTTWDTDWLPDQVPGSVKLIARIRDANGTWYVTPEVTNLTMQRSGKSIRMYNPIDVPTEWQTRASNLMTCHIPIPADHNLGDATAVQWRMCTWNGKDGGELDPNDYFYTKINDWTTPKYGMTYFYSYDILDIPVSSIRNGSNTIEYFATSMGHGIELLWPGPSFVVKYEGNYGTQAPAAPLLASPANNSTNVPRAPLLRWNSSASATAYHLQVASDSIFSVFVFSDSSLTDTSHQMGVLPALNRYFWRVRASNAAGPSPFSSIRSFTTIIGLPQAATPLVPANQAANQAVAGLAFRWNKLSGAATYAFQLGTDSLFAGTLVRNDSTLTDTSQIVSGLLNGTRYYWHIAGKNAAGNGPWSAVWRFTTLVPIPGALTLVSPADNAGGGADSMKCLWRPTVPASSKYWFEIARDSLFTLSRSIDSTLTDTTKTARGLTTAARYFWRVRGGSIAGWGSFSEVRRFTPVFTSVTDRGELPSTVTLNQNFPNPFNPSTQIEFGLPKESHVRLEVYDVLGAHVLTLHDGVLSAGFHRVTVRAGTLPSGVYVYRLTTPETARMRKMLLLR